MASDAGLSARIALQRAGTEPRFSLDVTLAFRPGLNVLFGPSGSGKSTILAAIAGLLKPDAGRVALGDEALFDSRAHIDRPANERRIALVFQSLALFPHLDALRNVAYGVPRAGDEPRQVEQAKAWLERMRVGHLARRFPRSFSGGEAQRVALARALASEPRALLLDEPFSALDRELASELSAELTAHVRALPIPVVLVTHDRAFARELGCDITLLSDGQVVGSGAASELLAERS